MKREQFVLFESSGWRPFLGECDAGERPWKRPYSVRGISPAVPGRLVTETDLRQEGCAECDCASFGSYRAPRFHFSEEQEREPQKKRTLASLFPGRAAADCEAEIKHCRAVLFEGGESEKSAAPAAGRNCRW